MSATSKRSVTAPAQTSHLIGAFALVVMGALLASSCIQTWLSSTELAASFISPALLQSITDGSGRSGGAFAAARVIAIGPSFVRVAVVVGFTSLVAWLAGAWLITRRTGNGLQRSLTRWGLLGWGWICAIDLWEWTWIITGAVGWTSLSDFLAASPQFWLAACFSGWMTTLLCLCSYRTDADTSRPLTGAAGNLIPFGSPDDSPHSHRWLWFACGLYGVVFVTMNWRLYFNLLMPHGDSVMYEEHLWNVLHGKGFRSYLDQGLFLGEHIQFVHLFLLPIYAFWPSHLLLELCESTALALGAWPVFWMTRRQTGSNQIALATAVSYLLYAPMQFLDIEIDLKTFRPEAFGIPLLLLTLDQLERRNLWGTLLGLAMTLTVKEDYAIVFGPLGLWIAWRAYCDKSSQVHHKRNEIFAGLGLSVFSVAYLWLATRVVMPWFRSGVEVHYARYFAKFGETPEVILKTMITRPDMVFNELFTTSTLLYAVMMLAPLACLPVFSPSRLAVGLPLFGILCLNELAKDPRHQFHAPLVAIVFWAMAGGLPMAIDLTKRLLARGGCIAQQLDATARNTCSHLAWTSALGTGFFLSLSPLGLPFWDFGSAWNWSSLYGPNQRGELFTRVLDVIPRDSRVASTDFVHPRFTHHERSYDYSGYARKVAGGRTGVPEDTDYLVIDTHHRYSEIKHPSEIPELHNHPDQWEIVPVETDGYFIVLKRRK